MAVLWKLENQKTGYNTDGGSCNPRVVLVAENKGRQPNAEKNRPESSAPDKM